MRWTRRLLFALRGRVRPTVRLRLTALYGAVFLVTGALLLTIGYLLVRNNLTPSHDLRGEFRRLGIRPPSRPPFSGRPLRFTPGSPEARVAAEIRKQLRSDALHRLVVEYGIALAAMTLLSVVAGWLLAGRALWPLRRITATAQRVSGENLGERIALSGPADELKELADTFDGMLGRLDRAFASQRHFVANASHELRTPLAIMRTEVEVTLADPDATPEELRGMGTAVRNTIDRCEGLLEGLLTLARSEAASGRTETMDLGALAGDCLTDLRVRAAEADVDLHGDLSVAWVRGEPALLERMIANLIENAIRYNRPGGSVEVVTHAREGRVELTIRNDGRRIDPAQAGTLHEPFRRLDCDGLGFGLGLSIVRSVVEAHGGAMRIDARPEGGLAVEVELPALTLGPDLNVGKESPALTGT